MVYVHVYVPPESLLAHELVCVSPLPLHFWTKLCVSQNSVILVPSAKAQTLRFQSQYLSHLISHALLVTFSVGAEEAPYTLKFYDDFFQFVFWWAIKSKNSYCESILGIFPMIDEQLLPLTLCWPFQSLWQSVNLTLHINQQQALCLKCPWASEPQKKWKKTEGFQHKEKGDFQHHLKNLYHQKEKSLL